MKHRSTPEQNTAREQLAENLTKAREKKARERRLYRVGEVMEAHGYEDPGEVEQLMPLHRRDPGLWRWDSSRRGPACGVCAPTG